MTVLFAAIAALLLVACGDETNPADTGEVKTTGQAIFDAYKNYKESGENATNPDGTTSAGDSTDPNTGLPCDEKEGVDSNGDGVISDCNGGSYPGDPGKPDDGGYGAVPLCPEIIGLNFDTCRPEMGRPVFILDFGRMCVLGMKCDYNGAEPACPMIWAPVCGVDGWTYDNDCFAKIAGVEIAYEGECWGGPNGPDCPDLAYPGPDFCPNGKIIPVYDKAIGCQVGWDCYYENEPIYCNADADCEAGFVCVNGMCYKGDGTDPNDPTDPGCPAIDMKMPDCGENLKPEPIYDAAGCQTGWACPL